MKQFKNLKKLLLLSSSVLLLVVACQKGEISVPADELYAPGKLKAQGWDEKEDVSGVPKDDLLASCIGCLPTAVDLTPFVPPVGDQGQTGTCVAWATAYYMKSTIDAIAKNIKTAQHNAKTEYSPKDLFLAIPYYLKVPNCNGTLFTAALNSLTIRGVNSLSTVPFVNLGDCSATPSTQENSSAGAHRIQTYRIIETLGNPYFIDHIKQRLNQKKPIVFGALVNQRFQNWHSAEVMTQDDILDGSFPTGGHAMTIVGYDDNRQAFRIVNSWGKTWGDNGYAWVDYDLMDNPTFCFRAFVTF